MRVNWPAVGVSGVVYWLFQAAWFTIFSAPWQNGLRMSPEEIAAYKLHPNFVPYVIALVCNLISRSSSPGYWHWAGSGV